MYLIIVCDCRAAAASQLAAVTAAVEDKDVNQILRKGLLLVPISAFTL